MYINVSWVWCGVISSSSSDCPWITNSLSGNFWVLSLVSQYVIFGWWAPRIRREAQRLEPGWHTGQKQQERFTSESGTIFFSQNSLWVPGTLEVVCGPNCPQDYPSRTHGGKTISTVQDGNTSPHHWSSWLSQNHRRNHLSHELCP